MSNRSGSELVVHSGHSVQVHPVAIYEVRRILLEHLKAEKICDAPVLDPVGDDERSPVINNADAVGQ